MTAMRQSSIPIRLQRIVLPALAELWAAYQLANCVQESPPDHGIPVRHVLSNGGAIDGLKWLIDNEFATTVPTRIGLRLTQRTRIVLTDHGAGLAKSLFSKLPNGRKSKPRWKARTLELWFGRELIKHFAQPSANQSLILTAFERCHWQGSLVDPLVGCNGKGRRRRLYDTIRRLNVQRPKRIRFFLTGNGTRVAWEPL